MNSISSILVHLDATPACAVRLALARTLALRAHATLHAMFVAAPDEQSVQLALSEAPAALLETPDWAAVHRARSMFEEALGKGGPAMRWLDSTGTDAAAAFCQQALYADLLVLGQRDPSAPAPDAAPAGFVASTIIDTRRPALVVPYAGAFDTIGRDVLIGWNATPEAAHAVAAALPWMRSARQVRVVQTAAAASRLAGQGQDIERYLHAHGITATLHVDQAAPADAGEMLLSLAADIGADLLVMGAYGHSRALELMLGGATRTVLHAMTLPVLMAH